MGSTDTDKSYQSARGWHILGRMAARGGLSLSVKMILTTTLLIVVTVVGSGVLTVINIRRVFDDTTSRQVREFENGRETLGETETPLVSQALQPLVLDNRTSEIKDLLEQTIEQD